MAAKKRAKQTSRARKTAPTKRCARCPRAGRDPDRPLSEFPRNRANADGLGAYCRQCKRDADRERTRETAPPVPMLTAAAPGEEHPRRAPLGVGQNSGSDDSAPARMRAPALEISEELITRASGYIEELAVTRRAAARMCGVSENTFKNWLREAADLKDDADPRRRLLFAIESAEGIAEFKLTQAYFRGAEIDPQVAQRFLERRFSKGDEKWARTEHLTVTDGDTAPMEMADARKLLADKLDKLLSARGNPGAAGSTAREGPVDAAGGADARGTPAPPEGSS